MPKFHSWVSVAVNQNRTSDTRRDYGVMTSGERGSYFRHRLAAGRTRRHRLGARRRPAARRRPDPLRRPTTGLRLAGRRCRKSGMNSLHLTACQYKRCREVRLQKHTFRYRYYTGPHARTYCTRPHAAATAPYRWALQKYARHMPGKCNSEPGKIRLVYAKYIFLRFGISF